jgi:hypothetical protein
MHDPIITQGLAYINRAKKNETNLIAAYFQVGVWLRDEFPRTDMKLAEFSEAAQVSRTTLYNYKQLAVVYGTLDKVPEDCTMTAAIRFREAYINGLDVPRPRGSGEKPKGAQAMIERSARSASFARSANNAGNEASSITDTEYAAIAENVNMVRGELNALMRTAKRLATTLTYV